MLLLMGVGGQMMSEVERGVAHTAASLIRGQGEMADRIRTYPWHETQLGPIDRWPAELLTIVNLMLASREIATVFWGADRFMIYNDSYTVQLGNRHPQALGQPLRVVWPEVVQHVDPFIDLAFQEGTSSYWNDSALTILEDGVETERFYTASFEPIWVRSGAAMTVQGVFQTATNNTARVLAERRLRTAEAQASRVLLSIGDAVIVTDAQACVVQMNPVAEALTGWSLQEAHGQRLSTVFRVVNEHSREPAESPADTVKRVGGVIALADQSVLLSRDGREIPVDDSGAPIRNEAGELTGTVLVFRDISERRAAERERDKERTSLRLAQEVAQIVSWEWDVKTGELVWIGDPTPIFGASARELATVEQAMARIHKDDLEAVQGVLDRVLAGRGEIRYEHRVVHADGTIRWLAARGRPLYGDSGEVVSIIGANTNITASKEIDLATQRTARQLALAIDAGDLATWYYDHDRQMVGGDARMIDLFGVMESEAPAETWIAKIHPEDQERVGREFAAALAGKSYDSEYRVLNGTGVRWVRSKANQVFDRKAVRLVGLCEDITARKEAQVALQSTAERLHMAQVTGRIASWDWNLATDDIVWNESQWAYGRPANEVDRIEKCITLIHPDDIAGVQLALQPAIEGSSEYQCDFRALWPDGSYHWMIGRGQGIAPGPDGKPTRMLGVNLDVTDRKLSEAALLQSEKLAAVGRLASSIAHEINNPLESVTNLIFLAKSSPEVSEETQAYLDLADRELRRVSNIASQTLRFHKQTTSPTNCTGESLFRELLSIYQGRLVNSHVRVEERYEPETGVGCFEGEIRQVLSNLVANAIDAMPHGGRLLLRNRKITDPRSGRPGMMLTVADTGTGMSPATRQKIFEAFYTTKGIGGTGLGLWVSKEIIERHKGALYVRSSQVPGHAGTVFNVFLPFEAAVR